MRRRGMWSHWWSGGVAVTVIVGALCAGIGVTASNAARASSARRDAREAAARAAAAARVRRVARLQSQLAADVSITPARGARDVALDQPVTIVAGTGRLVAARVTTAAGVPVPGVLSYDHVRFESSTVLAPGTDYRVEATVAGTAGLQARAVSTFHTLTPASFVQATLWPDQLTVGVAQPVVVRFDQPITSDAARADAIEHFTVIETKPVPGGWHWFSAQELHFRPQSFWPSGETVSVRSDLDGWNAGDGRWGTGHHRIDFGVGDARVSTANLATDQMTVTLNGRVIATYPMSGGRPKYPTMNGTHIVLDRESVVHMVSSTNGIPVNSPDGYDELVYSDVHISDSGEYVHAAPWSVNSQGHTNVSHGCINLSPQDAAAFMDFSRIGDVVNVVGGPRPPEMGDHGVMDWGTPWNQWLPGLVLTAGAAPPLPGPVVHHHAD